MQKTVQDVLRAGVTPMYRWLMEQARKQPDNIVIDGDVTGNPVACYVAAALDQDDRGMLQDVAVIHVPEYRRNGPYNRILTERAGYALLPDDFHEFLLQFHHAFPGQRPTAQEVGQWLKREALV